MPKIKELYIYMYDKYRKIYYEVDLETSGSRVRKRGLLSMILNLNTIMTL